MLHTTMVGMDHAQLLVHEALIRAAERLEDDPRLQVGFPFFGRYFNNRARVVKYHPLTGKLDVEVFIGSQGSSFIERDWDALFYLHGFDDSSYLALTYCEQPPCEDSLVSLQQAYAR